MNKTRRLSVATKKLPRKRPTRKRKKVRKYRVSPLWVGAALGAAIVLAVLLPHWLGNGDHTTGGRVPPGYTKYVLDISHYNKEIVWDSLKVAVDRKGRTTKDVAAAREIRPLKGVIIKATEGESMRDGDFASSWEAAGRSGIPRGAYHFFRSSKDPLKQAQNFIAAVTLAHADLPPVLDIETLHRGCTREQLNAAALTWLQTVEKHYGRTPVVYTSDSFARDNLDESITGHYPLWIARYNSEPPRTPGWALWQFSDKAVVYGIRGYVDLSVMP